MNNRRSSGLRRGTLDRIGRRGRGFLAVVVPAMGLAIALAGVAPAESALAQQNSGAIINLGGSIADTVSGAVSGIATSSNASGGTHTSHSEMMLGEQEGLAVSDASGGSHNASEAGG